MKQLLLAYLLVAVTSIAGIAQKSQIEIPLIDRSIFFGNPEIAGAQLSPDGKFISFQKEHNGIMNIWVKTFDEPFEKARRMTALERPVSGYFWTNDGKYIVYSKDKGGNENTNVYAVSPTAKADATTGIPASRNLTPNDSAAVYVLMVSKKQPDILYVMINDRDPKWHDLYKLEISSGKLSKVQENNDRLSYWVFDWDEQPRLAVRSNEDGSNDLLNITNGANKLIYSAPALEAFSPAGFSKDNKLVYLSTNKGSLNLTQLELLDPETGKTTFVEKDPQNKVDLQSASFSDVSRSLVYTAYIDAKERIYWKDKIMEADYNFLKSKFPGQEIGISSLTKDERKMLFSTTSDDKVASVYFFDRDSRKIVKQFTPRSKLLPFEKYLAKVEPITYKSSDGLEIPAYLTLPKGLEAKNLPLLVFPHGGPWARSYWGFNGFAQFFANRGFAVLDPNFRGSTGYGKQFLDAGNLQWGKLMQDDITWGVKDLIARGIVDPKRVAIMGGSYGGYATLAGLAFTPDVYAAGVDIVGPSNLFTLLSTIPPYWESFRKQLTMRMGDDATEEGKKILTAASPLFHAKNIKAPLLIIQGANDPRVKKAESDQIVMAMRDLGRPVEYIMADDEGHGFSKPVNNMAMIAASEKFLAQHLGTRYQPEMPDDVAKRLKEITIDIAAVSLAEKTDVTVLNAYPAFTGDLKAGEQQYDVTLELGGQKMPMTMTRTIREENGEWIVSDAVNSPMGNMSDVIHYNKSNLAFVKRQVIQGPATIDMTQDGKTIAVSAMGRKMDVPLKGIHLSDGAGMDMLIARLPLADGYSTGFSVVDMMTMGEKSMALKVAGKEVYKGADVWKVEMFNADNDAEKTIYWIDPVRKMAVKTTAVLPAAGNALMTIELK